MNIKISVNNKHFGGYEEVREINNEEELHLLIKEMEKHPQAKDFSTTITLSGIDGDGEPYFKQII